MRDLKALKGTYRRLRMFKLPMPLALDNERQKRRDLMTNSLCAEFIQHLGG
jgi:hypothetical protein